MAQNRLRATVTSCLLSGLLFAGLSHAASPIENLTIVVPYAPGGASDRAARIVSDGLHKKLGIRKIPCCQIVIQLLVFDSVHSNLKNNPDTSRPTACGLPVRSLQENASRSTPRSSVHTAGWRSSV